MVQLDKEDSIVQTFMGSTYRLGNLHTVGELRSMLEKIAADLPTDSDLAIAEIYMKGDKITYTLKEGIVQ